MSRLLAGAMVMVLGVMPAKAQSGSDMNVQVHGFATQSFLKSGANNYLGINTSSGSTAWTEAAINAQDQVTEKLRVGLQFHYTRLGEFGGDVPSVDWALGDYTVNQWLGVRAGKVKIRWGLYNDTQDYDPGYMWSLLPEGIYGVDIRATDLSQNGAELYGSLRAGKTLGEFDYSVYFGYYYIATNDGIMESLNESGIVFSGSAGGKTPGFDLRWKTPVRGLKAGGSLMAYDAKGNLTNGTYFQPLAYWPAYYAQYDRRKVFASYQYTKLVQYQIVTVTGTAPSTSGADTPSWFAMGGYRLTEKLQAGAYYTSYVVASAADKSNPANFFHDWTASCRYDINTYLYAKLEGHFIDGNAAGFYGFNNPNGFNSRTNLLVAKIGFTF